MKIYTDRRILVRLINVPSSAMMFQMLHDISLTAPNLRLEAVEYHSQKAIQVRLCTLDFDWHMVNAVNIPSS